MFLGEEYDKGNSVRDQDYEVMIREIPYRGVLLNSGHALVAQSHYIFGPMDGMVTVTFPRFYILEPGHATPARGEAR